MNRGAFTLVEVLIATALGLAICAGAFAALRLASQTVASANRLAIENGLMRAGVQGALDEIDFWRDEDDWADPAAQPLRDAAAAGYPSGTAPFRTLAIGASTPGATAFSLANDVADPKTWWRGQPIGLRTGDPSHVFGRFEVLARLGHPDPVRAWLPEACQRLNDVLGHYALLDYLPANAIYAWFQADGTLADELMDGGPGDGQDQWYHICAAAPNSGQAHGVWEENDYNILPVTTNAEMIRRAAFRKVFAAWGTGNQYFNAETWFAQGVTARAALPVEPSTWPSLTRTSRRFVMAVRFMNHTALALRSPLTGQTMRLSFACAGTTLRGARQQRGLDAHPLNGTGP